MVLSACRRQKLFVCSLSGRFLIWTLNNLVLHWKFLAMQSVNGWNTDALSVSGPAFSKKR